MKRGGRTGKLLPPSIRGSLCLQKPVSINTVLVLLVFCVACASETEGEAWETGFDKAADGGVTISKSLNGLRLSARMLPSSQLVAQDLRGERRPQAYIDSLTAIYARNIYIALSLVPEGQSGNEVDLMMRDLDSYDEYRERSYNMNFGMEERVKLIVNDIEYRPVLSTLENVYGLHPGRTILFVFTPQREENEFRRAETFDFIFRDELFATGLQHFVFHRKDM